jgi:hypothetical protein
LGKAGGPLNNCNWRLADALPCFAEDFVKSLTLLIFAEPSPRSCVFGALAGLTLPPSEVHRANDGLTKIEAMTIDQGSLNWGPPRLRPAPCVFQEMSGG